MGDKQLTHEEILMFGKMCGCERCKYCHAYQQEKVWLGMVKKVKNAKRHAEQAREHIKKEWGLK